MLDPKWEGLEQLEQFDYGTNCLKKQGVPSSHEKIQAKLDDFLFSN